MAGSWLDNLIGRSGGHKAMGMSVEEAQKIVNAYGGALAAGTDGIARPKSLLPCSVARIRYAFFVYVGSLAESGALTQKMGDAFVQSYGAMSQFIDDDEAAEINRISNEKSNYNKDDPEQKKQFDRFAAFALSMFDMKAVGELNDYISECYNRRRI